MDIPNENITNGHHSLYLNAGTRYLFWLLDRTIYTAVPRRLENGSIILYYGKTDFL